VNDVIVLGIETSCDETAAAVVEETGDPQRPWRIRSNVVASQVDVHREWGGVVPELSARQHVRDICGVVEQALAGAGIEAFDAIAVTQGPGLVGSLLVGLSFAKALAWARSVPLIPVHHLAGHIESLVLEGGEMPLPAVVLVVSGGHTSLYRIEQPGAYELLGRTRDDAAGEAFDKVAKLLGLGYPGGPVIDRVSVHGNDRAVALPKTKMTHADRNAPHLPGRRDFSFSGLKTSVLRHVATRKEELGLAADVPLPAQHVADLAASFQRVVVETLLDRLFEAARWYGARSVGIAGGVSANSRLREDALARGAARGIPVFIPGLALSTDNAAMIAAAGLRRHRAGAAGELDVNADASLALI
jgi:N6-L-threonylcarbamoyladenine synthase